MLGRTELSSRRARILHLSKDLTQTNVTCTNYINTEETLERIRGGDLSTFLEALESDIDLTQIRKDIWREVIKLVKSEDADVKCKAIDAIAHIAMAPEHVLRPLLSLHIHHILFNVISSERQLDIVVTCLELLTEMISEKPLVCQSVDGTGFVDAPVFTLHTMFEDPESYHCDSPVGLHQLVNGSFVLLSSALSVFTVSQDKLSEICELFKSGFYMDTITQIAALRAVYTVSFAQPEVAAEILGDLRDPLISNLPNCQNPLILEYSLGILSNLCHSQAHFACYVCSSDMFLNLQPTEFWNDNCHANYLSLLANLSSACLHNNAEMIVPLRRKCQEIHNYCLQVMQEHPFAHKVKACKVCCKLIYTEDTMIFQELFQDDTIIEEMLNLLDSRELFTINQIAKAMLILLRHSPINGSIDIRQIIRENPISSTIYEIEGISGKTALTLQAIDEILRSCD